MIKFLTGDNPFKGDRLPFRTIQWLRDVTQLSPMRGSGSPEGNVAARIDRLYIDTAGGAGSVMYVKRDADDGAGDVKGGWIAV